MISLDDGVTRRAQPLGDFFDMGGADFAATAHDGGPLVDPAHDVIGIGGGRQIAPRA